MKRQKKRLKEIEIDQFNEINTIKRINNEIIGILMYDLRLMYFSKTTQDKIDIKILSKP